MGCGMVDHTKKLFFLDIFPCFRVYYIRVGEGFSKSIVSAVLMSVGLDHTMHNAAILK